MEPGREGGMWLGVSTKKQESGKGKKFCFAAILNLTGDHSPNVCGRGVIVRDYLNTNKDFSEFSEDLEKNKFSGYNFVAAEIWYEGIIFYRKFWLDFFQFFSSTDHTDIFHHSNKPVVTSFYPGKQTLAFGNSPIFVPYAKVTAGRYRFLEILDKNLIEEELVQELLSLLKDPTRY